MNKLLAICGLLVQVEDENSRLRAAVESVRDMCEDEVERVVYIGHPEHPVYDPVSAFARDILDVLPDIE